MKTGGFRIWRRHRRIFAALALLIGGLGVSVAAHAAMPADLNAPNPALPVAAHAAMPADLNAPNLALPVAATSPSATTPTAPLSSPASQAPVPTEPLTVGPSKSEAPQAPPEVSPSSLPTASATSPAPSAPAQLQAPVFTSTETVTQGLRAGQTATLTITLNVAKPGTIQWCPAVDPGYFEWGDEGPQSYLARAACSERSLPAGAQQWTFTHVYGAPGSYPITVAYNYPSGTNADGSAIWTRATFGTLTASVS